MRQWLRATGLLLRRTRLVQTWGTGADVLNIAIVTGVGTAANIGALGTWFESNAPIAAVSAVACLLLVAGIRSERALLEIQEQPPPDMAFLITRLLEATAAAGELHIGGGAAQLQHRVERGELPESEMPEMPEKKAAIMDWTRATTSTLESFSPERAGFFNEMSDGTKDALAYVERLPAHPVELNQYLKGQRTKIKQLIDGQRTPSEGRGGLPMMPFRR